MLAGIEPVRPAFHRAAAKTRKIKKIVIAGYVVIVRRLWAFGEIIPDEKIDFSLYKKPYFRMIGMLIQIKFEIPQLPFFLFDEFFTVPVFPGELVNNLL